MWDDAELQTLDVVTNNHRKLLDYYNVTFRCVEKPRTITAEAVMQVKIHTAFKDIPRDLLGSLGKAGKYYSKYSMINGDFFCHRAMEAAGGIHSVLEGIFSDKFELGPIESRKTINRVLGNLKGLLDIFVRQIQQIPTRRGLEGAVEALLRNIKVNMSAILGGF